MEATSAGLTTGTLAAFTVVHGAATAIALTGSTADLTSGATSVLTATIQDAAGNPVTSDSTTVVTFAKQCGAGTVTGTGTATASAAVASKTVTGALAGPVTMEATAAGLTTGTLGAFTVVHGAGAQIDLIDSGSTASGDNHTLDGDDPRRRRQHRHGRQLDRRRLREDGRRRQRRRPRERNRLERRRRQGRRERSVRPDRPRGPGGGLTTGTATYTIAPGSASTADEHDLRVPHLDRRQRLQHERDHRPAEGRGGQRPRRLRRAVALSLTGTGSLSAGHRQRRRQLLGHAHLADDSRAARRSPAR